MQGIWRIWRVLVLWLLCLLIPWGSYAQVRGNQHLTYGLVAWLPSVPHLNNGRKWYDLGPWGLANGTITGALWGSAWTKRETTGLVFSSSSQYVDLGTPALISFDYTKPFTIIITFQAPQQVNGCLMCKCQDAGNATGISIRIGGGTNDKLGFYALSATGEYIGMRTTNAVIDGGWHQAAMRYDGSNTGDGFTIAWDGLAISNFTNGPGPVTTSINSADPWRIGTDAIGSYQLVGQVSMVAMYSRRLSDAEVYQWSQLQAPDYGGLLLEESTIGVASTIQRRRGIVTYE